MVSLTCDPFSLSSNETYSIDPNIQPDRIPPPPGGGGGEANLFMNIVVSSTGTYTYTWAPPPGDYSGVKLEIGNYWGDITPTDNQEVKICNVLGSPNYPYPTDAKASIELRDSSGNVVGYEAAQLYAPIDWAIGTSPQSLTFETAFVVVPGSPAQGITWIIHNALIHCA